MTTGDPRVIDVFDRTGAIVGRCGGRWMCRLRRVVAIEVCFVRLCRPSGLVGRDGSYSRAPLSGAQPEPDVSHHESSAFRLVFPRFKFELSDHVSDFSFHAFPGSD